MAANDATTNDEIDAMDLLNTLEIQKVERRSRFGGAWVKGRIGGYRFEALVFPEPAQNREWEINGDSRISKLWIGTRERDWRLNTTAYNWDRGADVPATDPTVEMIVELFADGLAETIFEND